MPTSAKKKPATRKISKRKPSVRVKTPVARSAREGSKASLILNLLEGATGATIAELGSATGWQPHSVRGFLSGTLRKKHGLAITSEVRDGRRYYRIHGAGARP